MDNPVDVWTTLRTTAGFLGMSVGRVGENIRAYERTRNASVGRWTTSPQTVSTDSARPAGRFPTYPHIHRLYVNNVFFSLYCSLT